jgi:hypothetical protein
MRIDPRFLDLLGGEVAVALGGKIRKLVVEGSWQRFDPG